jgi:UDP:flavonoid glycosyltransferase YjiC (YdhE family)
MKFVLAASGTHGDVNPYLAVALGLKARGHSVTVATCASYQAKVQAEGLNFCPLRPDLAHLMNSSPETSARGNDLKNGTEYILKTLVLPKSRETYDDLLHICRGADLLVIHPVLFPAPLVAEKLGIRWTSVILSPGVFLSAYDPPLLPPLAWFHPLRKLGPVPHRCLYRWIDRVTRSWMRPINALREEVGLPASTQNPIRDGMISPFGTLGWFSPALGPPQPDWPKNVEVTGFVFFDNGAGPSPGSESADRPAAAGSVAPFQESGAGPKRPSPGPESADRPAATGSVAPFLDHGAGPKRPSSGSESADRPAATGSLAPFHEGLVPPDPDRRLDDFLNNGEPPIVFTLGTSAVTVAGDFYRTSIEAVRRGGWRAVLLTGADPRNHIPPDDVPSTVLVAQYAAYSVLFPRSAAVVHSGGIGTIAQTLRAGVPSLVVPHAADQPDNAHRLTRLGAARTIGRHDYSVERVMKELRAVLGQSRYKKRAVEISRQLLTEDGLTRACEALERHAQS